MPTPSRHPNYRVEPLGRQHDRSDFSCGVEALDRYLHEQAGQDARKRVAAPFVLCAGTSNRVMGYYTLSALSLDIGGWPEAVAKRLPRYPLVPATLLGRLAVATRAQVSGVGEHLLMDALTRALDATQKVASVAVVIDAKNATAESFFRRYGFVSLADQPHRLFLATIAKLRRP